MFFLLSCVQNDRRFYFLKEESNSVAERDSAAGGDDGKEEAKNENSKDEAPEPKKVSVSPRRFLYASVPTQSDVILTAPAFS